MLGGRGVIGRLFRAVNIWRCWLIAHNRHCVCACVRVCVRVWERLFVLRLISSWWSVSVVNSSWMQTSSDCAAVGWTGKHDVSLCSLSLPIQKYSFFMEKDCLPVLMHFSEYIQYCANIKKIIFEYITFIKKTLFIMSLLVLGLFL